MTTSNSHRLHALDSLRGIAAFIVVLTHCFMVWPDFVKAQVPWISFSPARILIAGHASVILFFALSGYVLSFPFLKNDAQPYLPYIVKRICRIYIPFTFAIFLAVLLYTHITQATEGSLWFHNEWQKRPLTFEVVFRHLLMTGRSDDIWLDGAMWSLVDEMRISFCFPLLIIFCRKLHTAIFLALSLYVGTTFAIIFTGNDWSFLMSDRLAETFLLTARYIPFFMMGILLAKNNDTIQIWLQRLPRAWLAALLICAFGFFCLPMEIYNPYILSLFPAGKNNAATQFVTDALVGLAGGFFIIYARRISSSDSCFNVLHWAPIEWLGKTSYSLYLVHLPIVLFLFNALLGKMNYWLIVLMVIGISLATASIFYWVVERPSIRLGKYLAALLERRRVTAETVQP